MNKEIDVLVAKYCRRGSAPGMVDMAMEDFRAAILEARALGLEEAAKVADRMDEAMTISCAEQIRALKGE